MVGREGGGGSASRMAIAIARSYVARSLLLWDVDVGGGGSSVSQRKLCYVIYLSDRKWNIMDSFFSQCGFSRKRSVIMADYATTHATLPNATFHLHSRLRTPPLCL